MAARIPSVAALSDKSVAMVGLGALGSQIGFELARNGVLKLDVVDFDIVEPATVRRWISGVPSFGMVKPHAFKNLVDREYPTTTVTPHILKVGAFYDPPHTQYDTMMKIIGDAHVVVDASTEIAVNYLLSQLCLAAKKPYVLVSASPGVWGGRVIQFDAHGKHACWVCYQADREANPDKYTVPADPIGEFQPPGCAARTFTGTSFDLLEISTECVRVICGIMDDASYPRSAWQVALCFLRNDEGDRQPPVWSNVEILCRADCSCAET